MRSAAGKQIDSVLSTCVDCMISQIIGTTLRHGKQNEVEQVLGHKVTGYHPLAPRLCKLKLSCVYKTSN